jgi:hypothetical protein
MSMGACAQPDVTVQRQPMPLSVSRVAFVIAACTFTEVVRYVYVDVFASGGLYDYMGVRAFPVKAPEQVLFAFLAVAPSFWLPTHLRRPADIVQLFLYYAVHIPTCVLLPIVSMSPYSVQFLFAVAILIGLLSLELRYSLPHLHPVQTNVAPAMYWAGIALFYLATLIVFARSGYLSLDNFSLLEVYDQRRDLTESAAQLGSMFFYVANWAGGALAPFLIAVALHRRRIFLLAAGIALSVCSFIVSSNKSNYIAVPAVIAGYIVLRATRGRHIAAIMGAGFIALVPILILGDSLIARTTGADVPILTWTVFHRTFTNNGFLSAVYLDLFNRLGPAYYGDSFLHGLLGQQFDMPVPELAGASFTEVPDVHANANMWADAYANLGFFGIAFGALEALVVLWLYDEVSRGKDVEFAAAALIVPATVLANTSVHTALFSNGLAIVILLIWLWQPPAERRVGM